MKYPTLFVRALFVLALLSARGNPQRLSQEQKGLAAKLDAQAVAQVAKGFSGSVLVVNSGKLILNKDYGLPESSGETAFWIGSNTKQFAAAAILKLQEQGKLALTDPITKFFEKVPADKRSITVRQLLCHMSGLPHMYVTDGITDRQAAAKAILDLPLKTKPGTEYSYSNDGYVLLAIIIEIASGKKYEDYLRESILRPAGMTHTGFWGEPVKVPFAPIPQKLNTRPNRFVDGRTIANWGDRGSTGLYSTTGDQYKWLTALLSGKILSPLSTGQMWGAHAFVRHGTKPGQEVYYGYGWAVVMQDGKRYAVNHAGDEDWLSHNAVISYYEGNNNAYIILSNAGEPNGRSWSSLMGENLRALVPGQ